jgi:tetratricopeptide (TPR) repeat protein
MLCLSLLHFRSVVLSGILLIAGCATSTGQRIDNVPMYGQPEIQRPDVLKRADEDFIKQASAGLGGRENASKGWISAGDKFMREGNLDYAMRRYNQAWLLAPDSFQPFWGFGRVLIEWGKLDEAIKHLERANQLVDDPYQKLALLADTGTAYSLKANGTPIGKSTERARWFALANQYYEESIRLDANYPNSWFGWARSLYFEGRYGEAWDKIKKTRTFGASAVPPAFTKALEERMPEPK